MKTWVIWLACAMWAMPACAHRSSDAFVTLQVDGARVEGRWEIALRDLAAAEDIDADGNGQLTWRELRGALPMLQGSLPRYLRLEADGVACALELPQVMLNDRLDGRYAWLRVSAHCPGAPRELAVRYTFMDDLDPSHRAILVVTAGEALLRNAVLGPPQPGVLVALDKPGAGTQFADYLREGVHHILIGADHILFLLCLLLPAVLVRKHGAWLPAPRPRVALVEVLAVVTAFTLAHSITLSLAALDILRLPTRVTEMAIAASVLLAALNNIVPIVTQRRWWVAFGFGLVHGFGFASVLGELGLPTGARLWSLVAFNLGVEIGQLAIVTAFVPVAYVVSRSPRYEGWGLRLGSALIALLACAWLVQRATGA